ncbi:MAG: tRNA pseudouridine(55) synthase TruB [Candidatus Saccharimonadales bacterium]
MTDKLLLIDKPAGWTSFDVVAKIRGTIRAEYTKRGEKPTKRQLRVGHAGTLDPFATGLLVVLLGDECKRAGDFLKLDKTYEATIHLGEISTTGDPEGQITAVSGTKPTKEAVLGSLEQFRGQITQVPPSFSAIKINGQRAYKLAREGKPVEIPERSVTIHSLELLDYSYPDVKIRTHVSSGTYIRTLAEDIGKVLGTGAYCFELRRTAIDGYLIENAASIEDLNIESVSGTVNP